MNWLRKEFILLFPFLLTSCGYYSGERIYQQESINGDLYFSDIVAVPDSDKKEFLLSYHDIVCEPVKIKSIKEQVNYKKTDVTKNWLGIKTTVEYNWYIYDLSLTDEDLNKMSNVFRTLLDAQIDSLKEKGVYSIDHNFLELDAKGIAIGEEEKKVDGKYEKSWFLIYVKLNSSMYYNGNSTYKLAPE